MVLFGAWKGPRGYLGPIWPFMRCLGPSETSPKSVQGTTLAPSGPPGSLLRKKTERLKGPEDPSDRSFKFLHKVKSAFWAAKSSLHGLHARPRGRPMAEKAIKTNGFLTFSKSLKTVLGRPWGHSEASLGALGGEKRKFPAPRSAPRTPSETCSSS